MGRINLNFVLKGVGNSDTIECQDDFVIGGDLSVVGTTTFTGAATHTAAAVFSAGLRTKQAVNNVHDTTPTAAELTTSFGDPTTIGRGFIGTVDDADGNTNGYIVWASDASYYFVKGTKAT